MGKNLATTFSSKVDERFKQSSLAEEIISIDNAKWAGVETVNVYSMPVVPLVDYDENSLKAAYGNSTIIERSVQSMKIQRKRAFSFAIRRLDREMDQMASEVNAQLKRQTDEVLLPDYDKYVFSVAANAATANGNAKIDTKPTKSNAYELFLGGMAHLGNAMAPRDGRIAVVSYGFYNLLKQDPAFVRYGDRSQQMLTKGIIGEVDGVKIMLAHDSVLPSGFSCMITHPYAMVGPKKLHDVIIHDNPVGWNGWKVECLFCYDAFVLNNKAAGIYYIGASGVNKYIHLSTAPTNLSSDQTMVTVATPADFGHSWKYVTGASAAKLECGAEPGSEWEVLAANGMLVAPKSASDTVITVAELDDAGKVVGIGSARINMA